MLRLILGRAGTGKTTRVMREIRGNCVQEGSDGLSAILLVPEQYSHEAERELCRVCGDSMSLFAEVVSFTSLYNLVVSELGENRETLDKGARMLAMARALDQVYPALRAYKSSSRRAETRLGLLQAVTEMKSACIGSRELMETSLKTDGRLADKLRDIALILEAFNAVIAQGKLDPADRLDRLSEMAGRSRLGGCVIYIDGFIDFTAQENRVIEELLAAGAEITVCLTCDSLYGDNEVFEASRQAANRLILIAKQRGLKYQVEYIEKDAHAGLSPMGFLEENLFTYTSARFTGAGEAVRLYRAERISDECEMAAAEILRLVREKGCRFRDIAVAARGFEDYHKILEGIFEYYGIPIYMSAKSDLMQKPAAALIDCAFEVISGGWEYEDVFSYLRTGLAGPDEEECDILENYVILWEIKRRAWHEAGDWKWNPSGRGEADESDMIELAEINRLRDKAVGPLLRFEKKLSACKTARGFAAALCSLVEDINLPEALAQRASLLKSKGMAVSASEYSQLWDVIVTALEQFANMLGDAGMDREEFFSHFRLLLSQYEIGTIPLSLDTVSAGDMDRMRRRNLRYLIVLGASDDRLPGPRAAGMIFSDDEREKIKELGLPLPGAGEDGIFKEMNLIYNCLTLPSEGIVMSYAASGPDGGERRESFVMKRVAFLFEKEAEPAESGRARLSGIRPALELAAEAMRPGAGERALAARWFFERSGEHSALLHRLAQCSDMERGSLSKSAVRALYGEKPRLSASRAESLASCRFAYFMRHGLLAEPRRKIEFDALEMGIFMHYILEGTATRVHEEGGFHKTGRERAVEIASELSERYMKEELHGLESRTRRVDYLFRRMRSTVSKIVSDMAEELIQSDFEPLGFELNLPADDMELETELAGKVDRIDGYINDGRLYLRIVDYKTGKRSFSLSDVWYGMGLQMLIYLFSLRRNGKRLYGRDAEPAGVLYVPAKDVLIKAKTELADEEIAKEREKALRRSGLILDDPEIINAMERGEEKRFLPVKAKGGSKAQEESSASAERFEMLGRHVEKTMRSFMKDLEDGVVNADPYYSSQEQNACTWCEYKSACHFDESRDGYRYLPKLSAREVWKKIEEGECSENE